MVGAVSATVVSGLIIAVGVLGTIIPALPGVIVVFIGFAFFGFLTGWDAWAITLVTLAGVVSVSSTILGIRIPAKATGATASRRSLRIGILGGIIGFFVVPVVGLPLGWIAGVFVSEAAAADFSRARTSTLAALRSFGKAALVQFGLALGLAFVWGAWATAEIFGGR